MKFNQFVLLFICIIIGSNSESMSYWERTKSYFAPTPEQKLDNEFNDLQVKLKTIFTTKYSDPLPIIKRLYVIGNIKHSDDWYNIIIEGFSDAISGNSKTYYADLFVQNVIKPTLDITNYNKSLNRRLFEVLFSPTHEIKPGRHTASLDTYLEFMHKNNFFALLEADQAYPSILSHILHRGQFKLAFDFFKTFYSQVDVSRKNDYKKTIIVTSENAKDFGFHGNLRDFVELFLKPILEIEPSLYNDIFNAITTKYFNKEYPQDVQQIFSENIDKIITDYNAFYAMIILISLATKDSDQAKEQLLKLYFDYLDTIYADPNKSYIFSDSIIEYIGYNTFVEYLTDQIDSLLAKHSKFLIPLLVRLWVNERNLIDRLPKNDPSAFLAQYNQLFPNIAAQRKKISDAITQNIMFFNHDPDVAKLISDDSSLLLKDIALDKVVSIALAHIQELTPQFAEALLYASGNPQFAQAIITSNRFPEHINRFAQDILYGTEFSPTMFHLKRNAHHIRFPRISKPFLEDPELKDMYALFRKKEQELNKKGYYTFVHGQMRRFYFPEKLYTHLWGLRKKQPINNFLFAHIQDLIETPQAQFEEDIMRKTMHMAGAIKESESKEIDVARRKKVLFTNYAFFANLGNTGSNSAYYVIENQNSPLGRQVKISSKEPFTLLGYESIYNKYHTEIEQLAKDYALLSGYGNMLLIAIPKDKIYKYVYLCASGGVQHPLTRKDRTQITDIRVAMETLLNNPESLVDSDRIEFCLIMTQQKGGLDPSTGIQIFPLLSGDPEKLKVLQAREKVLLDKITADVKEQERQQQLERAAKIAGHVAESVGAK